MPQFPAPVGGAGYHPCRCCSHAWNHGQDHLRPCGTNFVAGNPISTFLVVCVFCLGLHPLVCIRLILVNIVSLFADKFICWKHNISKMDECGLTLITESPWGAVLDG